MLYRPFCLLAWFIWVSNILILSTPDEGYWRDESYALNKKSPFLIYNHDMSIKIKYNEKQKMPHCRNTFKMPHCRNTSKIPHCRNTSKIPHCRNTSKITHCQNTSKIPYCRNTSKIPHCLDTSKIPHCRNTSKIPHCRNTSKIAEKSISLTQIHDRSLTLLGSGTSIKNGGVKLVLWAQTSPLIEMMQ
jgi:hypothetical protein